MRVFINNFVKPIRHPLHMSYRGTSILISIVMGFAALSNRYIPALGKRILASNAKTPPSCLHIKFVNSKWLIDAKRK